MKSTRSDLFHQLSGFNPSFYQDIELLWNISEKQQNVLLDMFPMLFSAYTTRETRLETEEITNKLGMEKSEALKIIKILKFIYSLWNPREDNTSIFFQDFQELGLLPKDEEKRNSISLFLKKFFDLLEKDSIRRLDSQTTNQILPNIKNLYSTVENRAVVESQFDWYVDDPSKYAPIINRTVSVALLKIKLDEGDPIVFQCNKNDMEMLVRRLQSIIKEMEVTENLAK